MLRKILVIFAVFISAFNFASAVDDKEKIMTREDICIENFHKLFKAELSPKETMRKCLQFYKNIFSAKFL